MILGWSRVFKISSSVFKICSSLLTFYFEIVFTANFLDGSVFKDATLTAPNWPQPIKIFKNIDIFIFFMDYIEIIIFISFIICYLI